MLIIKKIRLTTLILKLKHEKTINLHRKGKREYADRFTRERIQKHKKVQWEAFLEKQRQK